jgi:hypothetical protein
VAQPGRPRFVFALPRYAPGKLAERLGCRCWCAWPTVTTRPRTTPRPGGRAGTPIATRAAGVEACGSMTCGIPPAPSPPAARCPRSCTHWLGHTTTVAAVRYQHVMADRDAAIARS